MRPYKKLVQVLLCMFGVMLIYLACTPIEFEYPNPNDDLIAPVIIVNKGKNTINWLKDSAFVIPVFEASDNIDGDITDEVFIDTSKLNVKVVGKYDIYFSVADNANNFVVETLFVNILLAIDTVDPVILLKGNNPQIVLIGTKYVEAGFTATDNIDGDITSSVEVDSNSLNVSIASSYKIYYSVSDKAGNSVTVERVVVVLTELDTDSPVIVLTGGVISMFEGATYSEPGYSATDNKDGDITNSVHVDYDGLDTLSAKDGAYVLVYTVSDSAGNCDTATRNVNVSNTPDTTCPVISLSPPSTVTITVGQNYSEPGYSATDDVDGIITNRVVVTPSVVNTSVDTTIVLIYTVSDLSGNAGTAYRNIIISDVADTIAPEISMLGLNPYTVVAGDTYTDPGATAVDAVDGSVAVETDQTEVNMSAPATYTVYYTATDNSGNTANATRTVIVEALALPVIFENFDDNDKGQHTLAATNFSVDDGWWYVYTDSSDGGSTVILPDPDGSFINNVTSNAAQSGANGMHINFALNNSSGDPYAGVACHINNSSTYYNFSTMTRFSFFAKGSGTMRLNFYTKKVLDDGYDWGHLGYTFTLTANWQEYRISSGDLAPEAGSPVETAGIIWYDADVGDKVNTIEFMPVGGNGTVVDFYIDEIKTYGVTY